MYKLSPLKYKLIILNVHKGNHYMVAFAWKVRRKTLVEMHSINLKITNKINYESADH